MGVLKLAIQSEAIQQNIVLCRWQTAVAAVTGAGHERQALTCQDFAASRQSNGVTAISLADGAGSARNSDVGAQCAVECVLAALCGRFEALWEADLPRIAQFILGSVLQSLLHQSQILGVSVDELACTILFASAKDDRFIMGHLGDGVIGIEHHGNLEVLSHPERGEHANETIFTTSSRALESFKIIKGSLNGYTSFILMSDGTAESLYLRSQKTLAHAAKVMCSWFDKNPPATVQEALLRNLRELFREQTTDACSIALMRQVAIPYLALSEFPPTFQSAFFDTQRSSGLRNRLSVLNEYVTTPAIGTHEVCKKLNLTPTTVSRHLKKLKELFGEDFTSSFSRPDLMPMQLEE
jgi:serine/threonine protein phosphatase PrpC